MEIEGFKCCRCDNFATIEFNKDYYCSNCFSFFQALILVGLSNLFQLILDKKNRGF